MRSRTSTWPLAMVEKPRLPSQKTIATMRTPCSTNPNRIPSIRPVTCDPLCTPCSPLHWLASMTSWRRPQHDLFGSRRYPTRIWSLWWSMSWCHRAAFAWPPSRKGWNTITSFPAISSIWASTNGDASKSATRSTRMWVLE